MPKRPSVLPALSAPRLSLAVLALLVSAACRGGDAGRSSRPVPPGAADVRALLVQGQDATKVPDLARAAALASEAVSRAESSGDADLSAEARFFLARIEHNRGRADAALAALEPLRSRLAERAAAPSPPRDERARKAAADAVGSLRLLSVLEDARQDYPAALRDALAGFEIARAAGLEGDACDLAIQAAALRLTVGDAGAALESGLEALRIADALKEPARVAGSAYMVGYAYRSLGKPGDARSCFDRCLAAARECGSSHYETNALNEIGNLYVIAGDLDAAGPWKERAVASARAGGEDYTIAACLHDLALYQSMRGWTREALRSAGEALAIDRRLGRARETAIVLDTVASLRHALGEDRAALAAAEESRAIAKSCGAREIELTATLALSTLSEALGRAGPALEHARRAYELKEALSAEDAERRIAGIEARDEVELKRREVTILTQQAELQRAALGRRTLQRNSLLAGIGLALVLLASVVHRLRQKAVAHERLRRAHLRLDEANRRLDALAREDPLTGLPNRRTLREAIAAERVRAARSGRPFGLLMADVDAFKAINDGFGHECGDEVLKGCAARFRAALRAQDVVGRWGGDEFVFLLPETGSEGCRDAAARIRERLEAEPFVYAGRPVPVSVSFGESVGAADGDVDAFLKRADEAMYDGRRRARGAGGSAPR